MNVLVTGGCGYVGTVLVRRLLDAGHSVVVLDRCFFGRDGIPASVQLIHADIREWKDSWLDGIDGSDGVCHLAGLSNDPTSEYSPTANWAMNATASEVLASACKRRGISRITFASSASIYDNGEEGDGGAPPMRYESDPVSPRGAYSQSKFHAEQSMLAAGATVLRQGTIFGYSPRMRFDLVVNTFVRDALAKGEMTLHGGGSMWRPLVSVEDVADAHIAALKGDFPGEIFNIVSDNVQVREVAGIVASAFTLMHTFHRPVRIVRSGEQPAIVRDYRVSGDLMRDRFGFVPRGSILGSATEMLEHMSGWSLERLYAPEYSNIRWMSLLERVHGEQGRFGGIYDLGAIA